MAKTTTFTDPQVEMAALEARAEAVRLSAQGATWHELETAHAAVETAKASGDINGVTLAIGRFATIVTALEDAFGITPAATPATPKPAKPKAAKAATTATPPQSGTAPAEPAVAPAPPTPQPTPKPQGEADAPAWAQQLVTDMGEVKGSFASLTDQVGKNKVKIKAQKERSNDHEGRIERLEGFHRDDQTPPATPAPVTVAEPTLMDDFRVMDDRPPQQRFTTNPRYWSMFALIGAVLGLLIGLWLIGTLLIGWWPEGPMPLRVVFLVAVPAFLLFLGGVIGSSFDPQRPPRNQGHAG